MEEMEDNSSNKSSGSTAFAVLRFAFIICLIASIVVSAVAQSLKQLQDENKELDKQKNILIAAGLMGEKQKHDKEKMASLFSSIKVEAVNLDTGEVVDGVDVVSYDQRRAGRDAKLSKPLDSGEDIALIKRRENVGLVYKLFDSSGKLERFIIPIRGYGLWSTMQGFLAISGDASTVEGITFYEHGETPGLGGEIDNPNWKALWKGKSVYGEDGQLAVRVIKGRAPRDSKTAIDGLSGATLTSRGVDNMIRFWLQDRGYGKYVKKNILGQSVDEKDVNNSKGNLQGAQQ